MHPTVDFTVRWCGFQRYLPIITITDNLGQKKELYRGSPFRHPKAASDKMWEVWDDSDTPAIKEFQEKLTHA